MITIGFYFLLILVAVFGVGAGLLWALRRPGMQRSRGTLEPFDAAGGHIAYLSQIRQALQEDDLAFVKSRTSGRHAARVRGERNRVLLLYLEGMRNDFRRLIRLARVIATLSPEVAPAQEWEQLRLSVRFSVNYALVRTRLMLGLAAAAQLDQLSTSVSELTLRIDTAMREMGERAALANELASTRS